MALARWQRTIVDQAGNVLPGASVEVRLESSGALAALKTTRAGDVGKPNAFTADENGFAFFYAVGGNYRIIATHGGDTIADWRDVPIGTAAETDVPVGVTRVHTAAGDAAIAATDQCLIIDKAVGEATTVEIPAAADRNGVDVIIKDGRGDADVNNITPSFDGSETCDGLSGADLKITTPFGMLWMRPRPDGAGYIQLPSQL